VLQKETVDLSTLVHDVVRSVEADAARGSVSLQVSDLAPPSMTLEIDPVRIREVLSNLLSNALRHTPAGGSVTVTINDATESVAVAVRDTGVGLTPEDLARVFDRFYKGPESRGSGLGLTIARSLVRAHGGDITASSHPGAGTTMIVALPRETDST
jgi:two-component system sensor histidine kinase BaeS